MFTKAQPFQLFSAIIFGGLAACAGAADETDGSDTDTDSATEVSSFTAGQYQMSTFVLLEADNGKDLDGDETEDNNLPNVLTLADTLVAGQPLSRDELNAAIAGYLDDQTMIILLDAGQVDAVLQIDILAGLLDDGTLSVDPDSLNDDGSAISSLTGEFSSETEFSVTADDIVIPVTLYVDQPPLLIPIRNAELTGTIDAEGSSGFVYGACPTEGVVDGLLAPLIPDEGVDINGNDTIDSNETEEALLGIAEDLLQNPNMADIVFDDGSRGVSIAFSFGADPASW